MQSGGTIGLIRFDWVTVANSQNETAFRTRFTMMSGDVQASGRKMVIALDNGGRYSIENWAGGVANCWTTYGGEVSNW